jgi:hypothetical protein
VENGGLWWTWILVDVDSGGRGFWWAWIMVGVEFICRVFHRDIPAVTGPVPLHLLTLLLKIVINSYTILLRVFYFILFFIYIRCIILRTILRMQPRAMAL